MLAMILWFIVHKLSPADQLANSLRTSDGDVPCFELRRNVVQLTVIISTSITPINCWQFSLSMSKDIMFLLGQNHYMLIFDKFTNATHCHLN